MDDAARRLLVIREAWDRFAAIQQADAPAVQVMEARRAFHSGAMAMLAAITATLPPNEDSKVASDLRPDAGGAALWNWLEAEVLAFPCDVEAGHA